VYDRLAHTWWDERQFLYFLRASVNPGRVSYIRDVLAAVLTTEPAKTTMLDVGAGGGLLAEEFAKLGYSVTGVDPSAASIATAQAHAKAAGLTIDYRVSPGEHLPFDDATFDVVYCCDVLEHVRDIQQVMAETARVLKPGGLYFYDTPNCTFASKLIVIKLLQEWSWTSFMTPNFHDWNTFLKPDELHALLARNGIVNQETRGLSPNTNPLQTMRILRQLKRGRLTFAEIGQRLYMQVSNDQSVEYIGYGRKQA
jgi:2-polyprenyl-6-hydroxyphenyl methylase/3-demethylubiquinone-9 3-methyltransferase